MSLFLLILISFSFSIRSDDSEDSSLIKHLHESLIHHQQIDSQLPTDSSSTPPDRKYLWNPAPESHPDGEKHQYKLPTLCDALSRTLMDVHFSKQDVEDLNHLIRLEQAIKLHQSKIKAKHLKKQMTTPNSKPSTRRANRKALIEVNLVQNERQNAVKTKEIIKTQLVTIRKAIDKPKPLQTTTADADNETETLTTTVETAVATSIEQTTPNAIIQYSTVVSTASITLYSTVVSTAISTIISKVVSSISVPKRSALIYVSVPMSIKSATKTKQIDTPTITESGTMQEVNPSDVIVTLVTASL